MNGIEEQQRKLIFELICYIHGYATHYTTYNLKEIEEIFSNKEEFIVSVAVNYLGYILDKIVKKEGMKTQIEDIVNCLYQQLGVSNQ